MYSSQITPRTNLNCGILNAAIILSHSTENCSHEVLNSQDQIFSNYELSAAVCYRELTDNYCRTSFSLSYKPLIWHAGNASIFASLLKRVTSLLTRSRDPSPLLRHPSVYSRCLATNEARRCEAMRDSSRLGSARLGSSRLSTDKIPLSLLLRNRGRVFRCYSSCMA
jgi:hypothetical protein